MVVFISDLHLSDGTCGQFHLRSKALDTMFHNLRELVDREQEDVERALADGRLRERPGGPHLKIVLLGDVFDMIHTTHWHGASAEETPWDGKPEQWQPQARRLLDRIVANVKTQDPAGTDIFSMLRGAAARFADGTEVEIGYVPGNHDRICNLDGAMRATIRELLGIADPDGGAEAPFSMHIADERHRVYGCHGCQVDWWNWNEGYTGDQPAEPIGDMLVAHLISALPMAVRQRIVDTTEGNGAIAEVIARNLRDLYDVRPLASVLSFLFHHCDRHAKSHEVRAAIADAVKATCDDFWARESVRRWRRRNRWMSLLLRAGTTVGPAGVRRGWKRIPGFVIKALDKAGKARETRYREAAYSQMLGEGRYDYFIAGHTHTPLQAPIVVRDGTECLYLNTGTWRPRYERTYRRDGYVAIKGLTYTVIYAPEISTRSRRVETWTGTLKDEDV